MCQKIKMKALENWNYNVSVLDGSSLNIVELEQDDVFIVKFVKRGWSFNEAGTVVNIT